MKIFCLFEKQYRGAKVIRLEQNYRSTQSILNAANAVISHNQGRKGKKLWTKNDPGDKITVYEAMNESDEANYVAGRIFSISKGRNFKDFAILYRTNAQSNALEYAFKRNSIPYRIIGGTRFFDRAEVKDMLAYLCVINNRADDLRLLRIINNPPRGIGAKTIEMASRQAEAAGVPLYTVISDPYSYPSLEKAAAKLMAFTVLIEDCAELLKTLSLPDFYEELLIRTGYVTMLEGKDDVESRGRLENIRELKSSIVSYCENTDMPTLSGFLEEIALYTDIEQYDARPMRSS
ncbi:MAG: ATP-dependent helicase [Oscillospiraceae bacterium]